MVSKYFVFILIVFTTHSFTFTGVHGQITCFNCNSFLDNATGAYCENPMNPNVGTIACPSGYVCTRVFYKTNQMFITSRSCDPGTSTCNTIRNGLQLLYPDLSGFQCNTCKTNYCNSFNSGFIVNTSLAVVIFGVIISKLS